MPFFGVAKSTREPNEEPEGGNADHAKRAHEANDPSNDVVPARTDQWYWRPVAIYVNLWQSMAIWRPSFSLSSRA